MDSKNLLRACFIFSAGFAVAVSSLAQAKDENEDKKKSNGDDGVEGVIRYVGSAFSQKVFLSQGESHTGPSLCRSDLTDRMGKLAGMTAQVSGAWKKDDDGKKRCFKAASFAITKTASGSKAVTGTLEKNDKHFQIRETGGKKVHGLGDVPDGMKDMVGEKVIVDMETMGSPGKTKGREVSKIISYTKYPD